MYYELSRAVERLTNDFLGERRKPMNKKLLSRALMAALLHAALLTLPVTGLYAQTLDEGPTDGSFTLQGSAVNAEQTRVDNSYADGIITRKERLVNARTWDYTDCSWGDTDAGKRAWSQLLAEMYKVRSDSTKLQHWINVHGKAVLTNVYNNTSTFNKPFSVPGYTFYLLKFWKMLPDSQKNAAKKMIDDKGWDQLTREDEHMDPIYAYTEKNSENFAWMSRLPGYLLAEHYASDTHLPFFKEYVENWGKALFNSGRIEWNSKVYWGYCIVPSLILYELAQDPHIKQIAQAAIDWQVLELALHWIDGTTTGADARAKTDSYLPFHGTSWLWGYLYFADATHHPSYSPAIADSIMAVIVNGLSQKPMSGFPVWSTYRPPQVAVDIAHRNFTLPVEIHSAKPFYQADYDEYAHWKGDDTLSRQFDFETIYLDKNYTLSSLATNYPAGIDCFQEQSVWKMAVKGNGMGAIQIFGNAGGYENSNLQAGRSPYEQIGQYRNTMMRLIKGTDHLWTALPKAVHAEIDGKRVYADMGNDVYVALQPWNATGVSSTQYSRDANYTQYTWSYNSSTLGALVLEVGTKSEHGSYSNFKSAIQSKSSFEQPLDKPDQLQYTCSLKRAIKMQFMPLAPNYQYYQCSTDKNQPCATKKVIAKAGVTPRVWCDGQYLDFSKWQSYHVSYGEKIIEQNWGSGTLTAAANGKGVQISINPQSAEVQYRSFSGGVNAAVPRQAGRRGAGGAMVKYSQAAHSISFAALQKNSVLTITDMQGRRVCAQPIHAGTQSIALPTLAKGMYLIHLQGLGVQKILVAQSIL
jgi:hypothetical protein